MTLGSVFKRRNDRAEVIFSFRRLGEDSQVNRSIASLGNRLQFSQPQDPQSQYVLHKYEGVFDTAGFDVSQVRTINIPR
jgi:hypothetical protein